MTSNHISRRGSREMWFDEAGCIHRAKAVHKAANEYKWPCGPVTVRSAPARRGSREMWFDVMELVHERYLRYGEATVLMLEDDMSVSPVYATYLELAMGMVRNESFIVGASLSPIRMNEMVEPTERWHGGSSDTIKGEKMYLSAVPSGAGGAYNNVMIGPFMRYLRLRMTYHDYDEEAKEERHNRAKTGEQEGQYVAKRLQPKALEVPGAQSNFWAHSWRKHMVEFMYANGYVMAFPNLPEEKGYATSLFLDSPAKLDGSPDLRVAKIQHTLLAWDPAWRTWPVLDLQMKKSSLHAIAMSSVDFMDSKHTDWAELISHWAQPQCLLDRSYTAHKSERPRALMYQPQSGVDSQLTAFQAATTLAIALGRTLIAPRLYSPTVCTSCSRRNMSYYFNMNAVDWSGGSVPVRAVVQTEADYVTPGSNISGTVQLAEARVWSYLAHVPNTALVAVPPKVKLPTLSLLSASNWLQCNDDTLFFDGLEENDLPRSAAPPLSEAVHRAYKAVTGLLKLPKKYMCMNLNSHDSLEACHHRRHGGVRRQGHLHAHPERPPGARLRQEAPQGQRAHLHELRRGGDRAPPRHPRLCHHLDDRADDVRQRQPHAAQHVQRLEPPHRRDAQGGGPLVGLVQEGRRAHRDQPHGGRRRPRLRQVGRPVQQRGQTGGTSCGRERRRPDRGLRQGLAQERAGRGEGAQEEQAQAVALARAQEAQGEPVALARAQARARRRRAGRVRCGGVGRRAAALQDPDDAQPQEDDARAPRRGGDRELRRAAVPRLPRLLRPLPLRERLLLGP